LIGTTWSLPRLPREDGAENFHEYLTVGLRPKVKRLVVKNKRAKIGTTKSLRYMIKLDTLIEFSRRVNQKTT